jgi:hypothetical protein
LKNLLPLPEGKRGKLRKACFTYQISAQIQFRNQKFCNELFGHLLYLNGYLTTIPTSAHTSVFILFLRVKPPLGLALFAWVAPKRGAHSTCQTPSCKRFFHLFQKKCCVHISGCFDNKNGAPNPRQFCRG